VANAIGLGYRHRTLSRHERPTVTKSIPLPEPGWVIGKEPSKPRAKGGRRAPKLERGRNGSKPLAAPTWVIGDAKSPPAAKQSPRGDRSAPGRGTGSKPLPEPAWVTGGKR
jgi:hypothetical protein